MKRRILLFVTPSLLALTIWLLLSNDNSTDLNEPPLSEPVVDTSTHDAPKKPSLTTEVVQSKSVQVTSQLLEGNCQLVDDGMPSFDEAFANSFAKKYAYTGVTLDDMSMLRTMMSDVSHYAALQFTDFKNGQVDIPGKYHGWALSRVMEDAKQGDAQAQLLAGSELMHRAFLQTGNADIESYRQGKQLLHQAASAGTREALPRLQMISLFSHRVIWRRHQSDEPEFYRETRSDYIAYRQLLEQHGSVGIYAVLLLENPPPQQSLLGLSEWLPDTSLLDDAEAKRLAYQRDMKLPEATVDQAEKERLAWLQRNIDLYELAISIESECKKLQSVDGESDTQ